MSDPTQYRPTLTPEEVRQLFEHLRATRKEPHVVAAFALPTLACLRRSELLNLKVEDIDEEHRSLHLGTIRQRVVTYPETLRPVIRGLMADRASGPIFDGPSQLNRSLRRVQGAASELKLEKPITFKGLRNTFLTLMVQAGTDTFTLRKFAGIRSLADRWLYCSIGTVTDPLSATAHREKS